MSGEAWGVIGICITTIGVVTVAHIQNRTMRRDITETLRLTKQVDHAVNNVPTGTPPLVQRVTTLEKHHRWAAVALAAIAAFLGVQLPDLED